MSLNHLTRLALAAGFVAVSLGVGFFVTHILTDSESSGQTVATNPGPDTQRWAAAQVADDLPAFSLPDLSGRMRDISAWRGDVLILNVWATWCAPCREEVPVLIEAQNRYSAQGVTVIGLTLDQPEPTRAFAEDFGINYPLLIDASDQRDVLAQLGSHALGVPHTFIVDREGNIVDFHLGIMSARDLDDRVSPWLNHE